MSNPASSPDRKQAAYVLPIDLIRQVKEAALASDTWPARVVEEALRRHLRRVRRLERERAAG